METTLDEQFKADLAPQPERPDFLKILCVLSFVCCGLMIIIYGFGTMALFLSEELINNAWDKIIQTQPALESIDRFEFFHEVGITSIYNLIGNIISLVGVSLMWKLNKTGFFIYAVAELAVNFFGMNLNTGTETNSYGGLIFVILIDLVFIVMYAVNLKHMNGKQPGGAEQFN